MANLYPKISKKEWFSYWKDSKGRRLYSEETCYQSFANLPDEWFVIHTTGWQEKTKNFQADGEVDFILINPSEGIFFCEVKGGEIRIEDGVWYQSDLYGENAGEERKLLKTPIEQAVNSKYAILRFLKANLPKSATDRNNLRKFLGHFIVLPGTKVHDENLGVDAPRVICLDSNDLEFVNDKMLAISDHYKTKTFDELLAKRIVKLLVPTREFESVKTRFVGNDIEIVKQAINHLTETQFSVLESLKENKRALIKGTAGTGKTVLATEKTRQLAELGFETLFVCFNKPLSEEIEKKLATYAVTVKTFHQLCLDFIEEANLIREIEDLPKDDEYWQQILPLYFEEAVEKLNSKFGAIVVDEGQDFCEHWFDSLQVALDEDEGGQFYIFADENQNIFERSNNLEESNLVKFTLSQNIRNTEEIAEKVRNIFGHGNSHEGVKGIDPTFTEASEDDQISEKMRKKITELLKDPTLSSDQIVVLCDETKRRTRFKDDFLVDENLSGVEIRTSSIKRFKGLEEDIVFLVLPAEPSSPVQLKTHAYVGMSRAVFGLHVYGSREDKKVINWNGA
tara:strand:- start:1401 stop:3098 length:1698 start_codon:yes stop_codon:yes gene_type:complete